MLQRQVSGRTENVARGRIRGIHFGEGVNWDEFTVVDHRDIPGPNEVRLIELDQPILKVIQLVSEGPIPRQ